MNEPTFTSIYERYAPDVLRFATYLTGSADLASDITAETFLRAWTSWDRIRAITTRSYLLTTAKNLIVDRYRRSKPEVGLPFDLAQPRQTPESRRYLDQTLAAIQTLPEEYRTPLVMYAVSELTYEEIAVAMELPVATVKVRIHRARLRLNEILEARKEPEHERENEPA